MTTNRGGLLVVVFILLLPPGLTASTIVVSSIPSLESAIRKVVPGDTIIVTKGVYTSDRDIIISRKGIRSRPITIMAEARAEVEITGAGGFVLVAPSAYIVINGFKFTHAADHAQSSHGTSFCRWTNNLFETPGAGNYLTISGSDHQVDYCTFQHKSSLGKFIAVRGHESQIAQRLWIHHNYFFNFSNQGGANGAEALQFGLSGFSLSSSNSTVEYNLFEKCHGENELISVKASDITLRFNTIRDCPAQFTLRHGNRCTVYANYFFNTPGIRIFGDDHVIHSNYFENCKLAINIGNGSGEVADGAPLVSHDRPDRVLIAFNTLVDNTLNIIQTPRKNGLGSTCIAIEYNIIQGGGPAAEIEGPFADAVWKGNIIYNTNGEGEIPASGYTTANPLLLRSGAGAYQLSPGSPAIDRVVEMHYVVETDMDGQPRISPFDVGADERSDMCASANVLNNADVGHQAKRENLKQHRREPR